MAPSQPQERASAAVTILYTVDEHGWILPTIEDGQVLGGAAELLGRWVEHENHCPGPLPTTGNVDNLALGSSCSDPTTLALSGGDNWTGPAISTYFLGAPMAEVMGRMGYVASAFGNHEFDFGRDAFLENRAKAGYPYLAANLQVKDPSLKAFQTPAFMVVERRGIRIGVVGLALQETLVSAMASRFEGIEFLEEEPSLDQAISQAWQANSDIVVLLAHECPDKLEPILARHPEWDLTFVGGGHCHKTTIQSVGKVPLINPGWRLRNYARIRIEVDPRRPVHERAVSVIPEVIEVTQAQSAPTATADTYIAERSKVWKEKLDQALGEQIGYSVTGLDKDSPVLARWIATAWRDKLGVDVAFLNKGGIRQGMPQGAITKATVYSILPFDNKLLICSLLGADLVENLRSDEAVFVGVSRAGDGHYVFDNGKRLDENQRYTVATIDFLYHGGDKFHFKKQDPSPKLTGLDWRVPVMEWTKSLATTASLPLEQKLAK